MPACLTLPHDSRERISRFARFVNAAFTYIGAKLIVLTPAIRANRQLALHEGSPMALAESWLSMSDDLVTTQDLPAVYTIGYGSRTVEETIGLLKQHGIECLIDVRTAPYSRFKPEFSKDALESTVSAAGIRYVYLGRELGGRPDDPTCYADGKVDYDLVRKRDFYRRGIEKVRKARDQHTRMCLMCSEGKPESCHRSALIGVTLTDMGISVIHLDEEGVPRTQQEVIARLTEGQGRLFEEFTFTSRKRYHDEEQEVE